MVANSTASLDFAVQPPAPLRNKPVLTHLTKTFTHQGNPLRRKAQFSFGQVRRAVVGDDLNRVGKLRIGKTTEMAQTDSGSYSPAYSWRKSRGDARRPQAR